jgi:hypothetical protein
MFRWIWILSLLLPVTEVGVHVILCAPKEAEILHHDRSALRRVTKGSANSKDLFRHSFAEVINDGTGPELGVGGGVIHLLDQKPVEGFTIIKSSTDGTDRCVNSIGRIINIRKKYS